jgi:hypothetical protein
MIAGKLAFASSLWQFEESHDCVQYWPFVSTENVRVICADTDGNLFIAWNDRFSVVHTEETSEKKTEEVFERCKNEAI